jgi:regulator of sirC expression with transglutaminase-like and TPR domain
MHPQSSDPFTDLLQGDIDLALGALLIAQQGRPELDIEHYLERLDQLAEGFNVRHPQMPSEVTAINALNEYLFDELGFRGNKDNYDDPANSYLDEVLDRRLGIPITLSLVYIEVGNRLGLSLSGVNFPFHFLVRCDAVAYPIFIDPFAGGQLLNTLQLADRLPAVDGVQLRLEDHYLHPASARDILARILRNLKRIHTYDRQIKEAICCGERIALLEPQEADNYRDLGFLYYRAHEYQKSLDAFEHYLRWAIDAADADEIRQNIQVISSRLGMLN